MREEALFGENALFTDKIQPFVTLTLKKNENENIIDINGKPAIEVHKYVI